MSEPGSEIMGETQRNWKMLVKELGEEKAREEVVRQLKLFITLIEQKGDADIFGVKLLPVGSENLPSFVGSVSVTLSYNWPG